MPDERTLEHIIEDLEACKEYNVQGTLQAAYRYMEDLRLNMLALARNISRLEITLARTSEDLSTVEERLNDLGG